VPRELPLARNGSPPAAESEGHSLLQQGDRTVVIPDAFEEATVRGIGDLHGARASLRINEGNPTPVISTFDIRQQFLLTLGSEFNFIIEAINEHRLEASYLADPIQTVLQKLQTILTSKQKKPTTIIRKWYLYLIKKDFINLYYWIKICWSFLALFKSL
jgi:hypothetical protein